MLESRACSSFFNFTGNIFNAEFENNSADFKIEIKNKMIS